MGITFKIKKKIKDKTNQKATIKKTNEPTLTIIIRAKSTSRILKLARRCLSKFGHCDLLEQTRPVKGDKFTPSRRCAMQLQRQKSQSTAAASSHYLIFHCHCLPSHSSTAQMRQNTDFQTFLVVSHIVPGQTLLLQRSYICADIHINIYLNKEKHSWELLNRSNVLYPRLRYVLSQKCLLIFF